MPLVRILDSGWLRVAAYGIVAATAAWWGWREQRALRDERVEWWPTYWFISAALLMTMGLGRAADVGGLVAEFGREQARSEGWYDTRRTGQAVAVATVTVVWLIGILIAIWRVPPRRRRYLPHVIALANVIGFAAVRMISLHQVDSLLYRRDIGGVRIVSIAELGLLGLTIAAAAATARFDRTAPLGVDTGASARTDRHGSRSTPGRHAEPTECGAARSPR